MTVYEISQAQQPALGAHSKEVLEEAKTHKALVIRVDAGATIPPCVMGSHTFFFIVSGGGTITVDGVSTTISAGQLVSIEPGAERSVKAEDSMTVLAIQVHMPTD
jgi:mannose-6-phosphate isomerase-like protein (cupin superfamily)